MLNQISTDPQENGFNELEKQLVQKKDTRSEKNNLNVQITPVQTDGQEQQEQAEKSAPKKYIFRKGDQTFELDEDAELEMTADKHPVKLSLRELKDRAAGDVAIKNRMHALAEEKKKVKSTMKDFATLAKKDPLAALEYISEKAKDADSDFEYKNYLSALAEQAEKLGQMDEKELKNYELEKKLTKTEQDLSLKQRQAAVLERKQELLSEFPEVGDQQFSQMVEAVLESPELSLGIENEHDLLDTVDELIRETLTQRDIINVIEDINPKFSRDNELIFSLSEQLRRNPDLDEEDIRDIIRDVISPSEKHMASLTLSQKQRAAAPVQQQKLHGASSYDVLRNQLEEQRLERQRSKIKR